MTTSTLDETLSAERPLQLDLSRLNPRRFLECVHCGLCTSACPTYLETGDENDGPRGRIHLMRAVAEGQLSYTPTVQKHLDRCLDCRSCETACPSGVHYGEMLEAFRAAQEESRPRQLPESMLRDVVLLGMFPYPELVQPALWGAKLFQRLGLQQKFQEWGLLELLPYPLRKLVALLPTPGTWQPDRPMPEFVPAIGPRRARVAFFTGCSASVMFPATNWNTVHVLARNGCDVVIPQGQVCCGAVHWHSGEPGPAESFARRNVELFNRQGVDAVITNCGGCGHMLKHAPDVLAEDPDYRPAAESFAKKIQDVSEFLIQLGPIRPARTIAARATYHDSCHLSHGMGVRGQPRILLAQIPGLTLVPLRESDICCGAAGTYNLTQPDMAERLAERKLANINETNPDLVVTGNVVCHMQLTQAVRESGRAAEVIHTIDLLARAYGVSD